MSKLSPQVQKTFASWGRTGGQKRAKRLSSSQRSHIASQAARARWKIKPALSGSVDHSSVRLQRADWSSPVYLEEVLADGSLSDWRTLYHRIADFPFGKTADALSRVLSSSELYGVIPLWRGILQSIRGGSI
jgi:hypothetical protein